MEDESKLNFDARIKANVIKKLLHIPIVKKEEIMYSNYPPGVTGNEYEIAGADSEFEDEFFCEKEYSYVKISAAAYDCASRLAKSYQYTNQLEDVKKNLYSRLSILDINLRTASQIIDETCEFEGVVLKQVYRGTVFWECPKCGASYEEDLDDGNDY